MDNNKSAMEKFLGELSDGENKDPFNDLPEEPFKQEEPLQEKTEEIVEDKPLPFNKDPKVQKFIEKEINKRMADFKPTESDRFVQETKVEDKTTDVLTRLIGNDTPEKLSMIKEFKSILEEGTAKAKQEALAELEARKNQEVEADRQAEQELEDAFESIEETYDVDITSNNALAKKTRQEFVSFVEKIAPKDSRTGEVIDYPDMQSAWETFSEMRKSTPSRAKELANRGMTRSAETKQETQGRVNWNSVDNFVESLGK